MTIETITARLVEIICQQEGQLRNARWELGVIHNALEAARAEASDWKRYAKVVEEQRDATRAGIDRMVGELSSIQRELSSIHQLLGHGDGLRQFQQLASAATEAHQ